MNVSELEAQLSSRIMGLEDEELKLREELECLRRLPLIAAEWNVDLSAFRTALVEAHFDQTGADRQAPAAESAEARVVNRSENALDHLRRRLMTKRGGKSKAGNRKKPAFNSRILSEARA